MTKNRSLLYDILLIITLALAAWLRTTGLNWDQNQHLHPDERFLTMVTTAIASPFTDQAQLGAPPSQSNQPWRQSYAGVINDCENWGSYFDTACSAFNPNNRGYTYYVYGTLPVFITRIFGEALTGISAWASSGLQSGASGPWADVLAALSAVRNWNGYDEVPLLGRQLAVLSDLGSLVLLFFIARRLYGPAVGVLAMAFGAFSVMLIQQAHFYVVDSFTNFFIFLAVYFAVELMQGGLETEKPLQQGAPGLPALLRMPVFWNTVGFGVALGAAMASKINAAPLAVLLPGAFIILYFRASQRGQLGEGHKPDLNDLLARGAFYMVVGALAAFIAFRIFQPYAFRGDFGFVDVRLNPHWVQTLRDQRAQASGDVDFPPALQWARRSGLYSFMNIMQWGLGWPLGILAWAGMAWMGWRILKGEWKEHSLLWGWTLLYFAWQSTQWNPTMRYQLPIYPLLALAAAWMVFEMAKLRVGRAGSKLAAFNFLPVAWAIGGIVLFSAFAWSFVFTRIYTRDHSRVQATRWIYQNIPGPVSVAIETENGTVNQPLSYPQGYNISRMNPYVGAFSSNVDGLLRTITLPRVQGVPANVQRNLLLEIFTDPSSPSIIQQPVTINSTPAPVPFSHQVVLENSFSFMVGQTYLLRITLMDAGSDIDLCGGVLGNISDSLFPRQEVLNPQDGDCVLRNDHPYLAQFAPQELGVLTGFTLSDLVSAYTPTGAQTLTVSVIALDGQSLLGQGVITADFSQPASGRGGAYTLALEPPVMLKQGEVRQLRIETEGGGLIKIQPIAPVNESSWDDGLPLRMDGYDGYGGIYQGGLNFEMYWDDNADKRNRFITNLNEGDYIFISSNRQWGTTVRVPERYPLTSAYYRALLGCPAEKDILWCYTVAEPGMFAGQLGYNLVQTFTSYPTLQIPGLLRWEINTQPADEAFTVYDHPKVFIFKKADDYDPARTRAILEAVDLSKVVRITPRQAGSFPANLLLPEARLAVQRAGGTWSDLFSYDALLNRYPVLGLVVWYLFIFALGVFTYPIVRAALPGLHDRGYPLARGVGLVLWAWLAWMAGSLGWTYTRGIIGLMLGLVMVLGLWMSYRQRDDLSRELQTRWRYFVSIEGLFLGLFLINLLIRLGNPDLWHPAKGGERPMNFSYFNAILKSTTFPPYDPWFAGGYINYYYYGYVIVGTPVKFLGIVPATAYNLILPTLFALLGVSAFSVVWNMVAARRPAPETDIPGRWPFLGLPFMAGGAAMLGVLLLGNLGVPRMIILGFQKMAAPGGVYEGAGFLTRLGWTIQGLFLNLGGAPLPYAIGDWYWLPSRVIPAPGEVEPITEFPLFTFLYSDLHAHLISLPLTVLALAWVVSLVRARGKWDDWFAAGLSFFLGGLFIGALRPTNTWDFPTYLALASLAVGYTLWRYADVTRLPLHLPGFSRHVVIALGGMGLLAALSLLLYQPFAQWYGLGYSAIDPWNGTQTPFGSYITQWGLFLFVIVTWMVCETIDWMASTPVSSLSKLRPYLIFIEAGIGLLIAAVAATLVLGVKIGWIPLILGAWAALLILRPGLSDMKRGVLFMVGTGLALTLMVELVVLRGDISRMNTVFKFYLQVWTLFGISAAAALGWLLPHLPGWGHNWRTTWTVTLLLLVTGTAMFSVYGTFDKVRDRWNPEAPRSLDSMAYMPFVTYGDQGQTLVLGEDYRAIRWLQDNVLGSPVIVEANTPEYRWGSRMTIYTGLPGVVGWNWHQRQQRALTPGDWVFARVAEIGAFYNATDPAAAQAFLNKYDIAYIIVGQLERAYFPGPGLEKFPALDGQLWDAVYRDGQTAIYKVKP